MEITEKLVEIPSLKEFIQKNQVKCENRKVYIEVDEDLVPYWIEKNKSEIIDAVNEHDKKCVNDGNKIANFLKKGANGIFEYAGKEGEKYYNEKFGNGKD